MTYLIYDDIIVEEPDYLATQNFTQNSLKNYYSQVQTANVNCNNNMNVIIVMLCIIIIFIIIGLFLIYKRYKRI